MNQVQFLNRKASEISRITGQYSQSLQSERLYEVLTYTVYYRHTLPPAIATDTIPPVISSVKATVDEGVVDFTVQATDSSGLYRVIITWTDGKGQWQSLDLTWDSSSSLWQGSIPTNSTVEFLVQVIDVAGNVTADTNRAEYFKAQTVFGNVQVYLPSVWR